MGMVETGFGRSAKGEEARLFTMRLGEVEVAMSDYGATLLAWRIPAGRGRMDDILLGFDNLAGYEGSDAYFGATVGRFANRIAKARFTLDGKTYLLAANNGANHLHGGLEGFDRRVWRATAFEEGGCPGLRFELKSRDGDQGYPGALEVVATYRLLDEANLDIVFEARSDAPTIVGLTQHAYFNLHGEGRQTVLDHSLGLKASAYLPVDDSLIPTGELASVEGGPFDFRAAKTLGRDMAGLGGYDHCFVIDEEARGLDAEGKGFAELRGPAGRLLRVSTTLPGVQLYTGNYLEGIRGKGGRVYAKHSGLCLETQLFPDSPNQPRFPSPVLRPGEVWRHRSRYGLFF
jgi:aldose 1-epimerase